MRNTEHDDKDLKSIKAWIKITGHSILHQNVGFLFKVSDNSEYQEEFFPNYCGDRGERILLEKVVILEH